MCTQYGLHALLADLIGVCHNVVDSFGDSGEILGAMHYVSNETRVSLCLEHLIDRLRELGDIEVKVVDDEEA
jgi:hypothetical protein